MALGFFGTSPTKGIAQGIKYALSSQIEVTQEIEVAILPFWVSLLIRS
jgi:hypothetical protein